MALAILILSIALQFAAAILALNLIRKTRRIRAWLLIATALVLMGVRRTISLVNTLASDSIVIDPFSESVALLISCLMLSGVWLIGGVFGRLNRLRANAEAELNKRKAAEQKLRESETRFRTLFNNAAEGILVADVESKGFTYANPTVCTMLGYSEAELTRLEVPDIHPPESRDHVLTELESQAQGRKTLANDIPCLRKDGVVIFADLSLRGATSYLLSIIASGLLLAHSTERDTHNSDKRPDYCDKQGVDRGIKSQGRAQQTPDYGTGRHRCSLARS